MDGDSFLPSDDLLGEQAYLIARGVRRLALVGMCPAEQTVMTRVATRIEEHGNENCVPFVVNLQDGHAAFGYASAGWALDLYEWIMTTKHVPQEQRERVLGLLLGYGTEAISHYESQGTGRRFSTATALPG